MRAIDSHCHTRGEREFNPLDMDAWNLRHPPSRGASQTLLSLARCSSTVLHPTHTSRHFVTLMAKHNRAILTTPLARSICVRQCLYGLLSDAVKWHKSLPKLVYLHPLNHGVRIVVTSILTSQP